MQVITQQVARVKRRLDTNLFFDALLTCLGWAAVAAALTVALERIFVWGLPLEVILGSAGGLALVAAMGWTLLRRHSELDAAVRIDRAAGLKERVSSAVALEPKAGDEFVSATIHDAARVAASVHVPTHVPLNAPRQWPLSLTALLLAGLTYTFLPVLNLFPEKPAQAADAPLTADERKTSEEAVNRVAEALRERADKVPGLEGLKGDLASLDIPDDPTMTPEDVRREVVKRTENIADKLREKLDATELKSLEAMKRELAKLETPKGSDPASKLSQALAEGNAEAAAKALDDLKKELAEAEKNASDPAAKQQLAETAKKLEELSKQLEQLANNDAMKKELENKAGLDEKAAEDLLEKLAEKAEKGELDQKQIEEMLKKAMGDKAPQVSPEQLKQMAEKLAQSQKAKDALKKMAKSMSKAAKACENPGQGEGEGQASDAAGALQAAADQLSEMEMAEQMANELEAAMGELKDLQNKACQGQGICRKPGGPPGDNLGQGYGPQDKKAAAHGYEATRIRAKLKGGEIIGQMLVDGPMVRGEASVEVQNAVNAAVRDATDAIDRQDVPRQYEKVLRNYFMSLAGLAGAQAELSKPDAPAQPAPAAQPAAAAGEGS